MLSAFMEINFEVGGIFASSFDSSSSEPPGD
jgi:hypothetical protein